MRDDNLLSRYNLPANKDIIENIAKIYRSDFVEINGTRLIETTVPPSSPYYLMQCFSGEDTKRLQGQKVSIRYRISTIISKFAHFYYMTTTFPIQNLSMVFKSGNTDIRRLWVVPHFSSENIPKITYTPNNKTAKEIEVSIGNKEWIYPGNGVTFIWRLNSEGVSR
jgi:hypothetical protein